MDDLCMCGSHREAWRRRCDDALLVTMSVIYFELEAHFTSILQRYAIPSSLCLVELSFVFQQDNNPKDTSKLSKGYLTKNKRDGVLHQMTWPPQSPDVNPFEMVWDESDHRKKPTNAQHMWELLQYCWKSIPGEAG